MAIIFLAIDNPMTIDKTYNPRRLSSLLDELTGEVSLVNGDPGIDISSVEYNSGKVGRNSLFVAVPGLIRDGHDFIEDAVNKGASAVLISESRINDFTFLNKDVSVLSAQNTRKALSGVSAAFFGNPSSKVPVIGVTGTNGKTSITYMIEAVLKQQGLVPGVVGTVNYRWKDKVISAPNTTPESKDLQEMFAGMVADGVNVIIMEVSSHSLKLFRVEDIEFDIALFTNLTRDHLDFHATFEDYFDSKKKLFHLLQKSCKDNKAAVVNVDDEYGMKIYKNKSQYDYPLLGFGTGPDADIKPFKESIKNTIDGVSYTLEKPLNGLRINLNIPGSFQIYNSLCAFGACYKMNIPPEVISEGLSALKNIPGRFNSIKTRQGFSVIVDYAHTDDGVQKLLASVRELNPARIITLLGCGGNRDKTKRPLMGKTAVCNSDWVIFTSDNPRDEDPDEIIRDIIQGMTETNFEVITDREAAIKSAVFKAGKNDIVVIAGKGHEDYQIIKGRKNHFDDREMAVKYIEQRESL